MGKQNIGAKVSVPGVGKGLVESQPYKEGGKEMQNVRIGDHKVIKVPTDKL